MEASGTSGMKAAMNGVPSLSVLDGWWVEGHIEGVTGWSIGEKIEACGSPAEYLQLVMQSRQSFPVLCKVSCQHREQIVECLSRFYDYFYYVLASFKLC